MPREQSKVFCPMYRQPVIKRYQKGWRIEFYYAENGELHRQDIRVEKYRRKFANAESAYYWLQENVCVPLTEKLRNGWTPKDGNSITTELIKGKKITIQALIDEFVSFKEDALRAKQLTEGSFVNYYQRIEVIRKSMKPEYSDILLTSSLEEFTPMKAKKYIMQLAALREWEVKTTNNFIKFWRMLYKFAIDNGYTDKNPFEKVSLFVGEEKSKRPLTQAEQTKIYNYLIREDLPFFIFTQLVYIEGIRPGEILRLQAKDLDVKELRINVPASKTKNHKAHTVLVPDSLKPAFAEWLQKIDFAHVEPSAYLFHTNFLPGKATKPLTSDYSSTHWKQMREKLDISAECKLYGLRHTGITDLLNIFSVNAVRMHIGHSTTTQTLHYANHENENLQREIAAKAPIYGLPTEKTA